MTKKSIGTGAFLVAVGILLSRLMGLVRQRVFNHYFGGTSDAADAFLAAFKIPNFLQNLFGEGVLSASFIPVYASLIARGDEREAGRVAATVFVLLTFVTSLLVLLGVIVTPMLISLIAPGFEGEKRELTIQLVRILFPGAGLLVTSAWCLGILNSHHRFLLSYTAPVVWNVAMIGALMVFGGGEDPSLLAVRLAQASVVGSFLQFAVQLPTVLRLAPRLVPSVLAPGAEVRQVLRNYVPVFIGRGVVQISAYVDALIASLLPTGAVTGITNAQILYTLPVSLFGMSMSAAELPAMSSATGSDEEIREYVRSRLAGGLRRIAFFIIPSVIAFIAFGDVIAGAVYQSGRFTASDADYVWGIVAASSVGLLASTLGRLYSSAYYALRDTDTPLRYAVIRVVLSTVFGYLSAVILPPLLGIDARWGVAGLTFASGVVGWLEYLLLRSTLGKRIGETRLPAPFLGTLWGSAAVGAGVGWAIKIAVSSLHPLLVAVAVLLPFGVIYFGLTAWWQVPESREVLQKILGRVRRAGRGG